MNEAYKKQVSLLIRALPVIAKEQNLALHGGTAINLFVKEMPRLSVDIDLTYLPLISRKESLNEIKEILERIKSGLNKGNPGIHITGPSEQSSESKIICILKGVQIKIEINTINRGSLRKPESKQLCRSAQKEFNLFAEIPVIPEGQLYGGKICAALDRQHPRDIFDIKYLPLEGINNDLKYGFLFCLLSSARPIHELLNPSRLDQRNTMENHFAGMARESFTYEDFESTREKLISIIRSILTKDDKEFLISFKAGEPDWSLNSFSEFKDYPAINWKLQNIRYLKINFPDKYQQQLELLKRELNMDK